MLIIPATDRAVGAQVPGVVAHGETLAVVADFQHQLVRRAGDAAAHQDHAPAGMANGIGQGFLRNAQDLDGAGALQLFQRLRRPHFPVQRYPCRVQQGLGAVAQIGQVAEHGFVRHRAIDQQAQLQQAVLQRSRRCALLRGSAVRRLDRRLLGCGTQPEEGTAAQHRHGGGVQHPFGPPLARLRFSGDQESLAHSGDQAQPGPIGGPRLLATGLVQHDRLDPQVQQFEGHRGRQLAQAAPPGDDHGSIQSMVCYLVTRHLTDTGSPCRVVTTPGVIPRADAAHNERVPDLGITCTPAAGGRTIPDPVVLIEVQTGAYLGEDDIVRHADAYQRA